MRYSIVLFGIVWAGGALMAQAPGMHAPEKAKDAVQAQAEQQQQQQVGQQLTDENIQALVKDELQSPESYRYDPRGRRDPFRSLLVVNPTSNIPCEKGTIGCLMWDDITLQGVWKVKGVFVSQILAKNGDVYWVRAGDSFFDGQVTKIGINCVYFKQKVNDPTKINPFRDVERCLIPEAAK
jgi:hypothetical protein